MDPQFAYLQASAQMERDTALLAYLLSQRNNVLSMADRGPQVDFYGHGIDHVGGSNTSHLQLPYSSMADRRLSVNLFPNKRFSLDLGGPSDHFLSQSFHTKFNADKEIEMKSAIRNMYFDASQHSHALGRATRRMSNLGVLSANFFEDHAKASASRRDSMASAASFASADSDEHESGDDINDEASALSEIRSDDREDDAVRRLAAGPILDCGFPTLAVSEIKDMMEALTESMGRSQKSQQAIHDWDKKMGLKRSHSKTMRLSMRSRKKLKVMIKKDASALPV